MGGSSSWAMPPSLNGSVHRDSKAYVLAAPRCELWARRSPRSARLVNQSPSAGDGRLRLERLLYLPAVLRP